jgi:glycosyltransferase involved in cell wall biosynthesis
LLRGVDVFVLPSLLEGIPRCLMESMAAGVPIAASDIPGCRELIEHGVSGLLFQPGDVGGLVHAMQALHDPALRRSLSVAAREKVVAEFSAAAMARAYTDLYGRVAG